MTYPGTTQPRSFAVGIARRLRHGLVIVAALLATGGAAASAAPITFDGLSGNLAASAKFDTVGTHLIVTLTNTSANDVLIPADVLTGVFFNAATALTLTPISAVIGPGSSVLFGGTDPGGVVGGEWAYKLLNIVHEPHRQHGISSSGLGLFGPGDRFPGSNLQGPANPGGLEYGITSAGDNPATGNAPVTGGNALIKNEVIFTLSGVPAGFDPSTQITNVVWQYGTSLSEPHFPEPATLVLVGIAAAAGLRWKRPGLRAGV